MIVVESGGTKSTWIFRDQQGTLIKSVQDGLHPQEITPEKKENISSFIQKYNLIDQDTYFYGAGCESKSGKNIIDEFIRSIGSHPKVIDSDVVGACMAVLGNKPGVVGILGTGAVVAQYDGQRVNMMASGRGYILGDEGSGFDIGRRITIAYLDGLFEKNPEIKMAIEEYYGGAGNIVHACSAPGCRFKIAGLTKVIATFKSNESVKEIIDQCFNDFIDRGVNHLDHQNEIGMVGSVAFYFEQELSNVLKSREIVLNVVIPEAAEEIFQFIDRK